jgi:hypothetical protein
MYGGLLKSASALAIVAGVGLSGISPATAADLGGDCCADLEERVAELEATTARKGTRKVSLTISGQISQELLFWDDGIQNDMYVTGANTSNSRWRFLGTAKISPEVTAGFLYEMQTYASASSSVNQINNSSDGLSGNGDDLGSANSTLREAMVWIEHSRLGRVSIGHGSNAANNSILVDLSGKGMAASNGVFLHPAGFYINNGAAYSSATWNHFFQGASGEDWLNTRNEHIQYRTPTFAGFSLGTSVGEDNYWDVEGRYSGEFNGVRIAARLAYSVNGEFNRGPVAGSTTNVGNIACATNCAKEVEQLAGSLSIRHMPTGLFFTGAAGWRDTTGADIAPAGFDSSFYYLSAGVARNITGLGDTVFYGEYSEWTGVAQSQFGVAVEDTSLRHWGVGIVQHVDAAAMEFWLAYKNYSLHDAPVAAIGGVSLRDAEDLHSITAGTRIRF